MRKPNQDAVIWWLELVLKLGMLTVGFLQASSLTFGRPIISVVLWPTLFLGGMLMLYRLWRWKQYAFSANLWLLALFCVSYVLSSLANIQYGWYANLRTWIWMVFLMFLLYGYRREEGRNQYRIVAYFYILGGAVLTLASFYFLLAGYEQTFFVESGPVYYIGFKWGRLYGAYWDPNIGALLCCVSVLLSLGLMGKGRPVWLRLLLWVNIVLEILYIAFSDSRAGHLCLCVGMSVYVLLYLWPRRKKWLAVLGAIVMAAAMWFAVEGIQQAYNQMMIRENITHDQEIPDVFEESGKDAIWEEGPPQETVPPPVEALPPEEELIGREEDYNQDISNRRFDIWKSALEIFKEKPVLGIGHENVLAYVEQNMPDSYLITNDHMKFSSMHSIFFDILVGQGAVGVILFVVTGILFAVRIIRRWPTIRSKEARDGSSMYIAMFTILVILVTAGCVMTEIIYVSSPMSTMFWISLSQLVQKGNGKEAESQRGENTERVGGGV